MWTSLRQVVLLLCLCAVVGALAQEPSVQKSPTHTRSPLAAAKAQLARGDLQSAESSLWLVLSLNPNDKEALTLLGIIRGRQHRYPEAESLFRRLLQIDPKSHVVNRNLARALVGQDKVDEAIEQYQQAESLAPEDSDLKLELARLYVGSGRFTPALAILEAIPQSRFPAAGIPVKAASLLALGRKSEAVKLAAWAKGSPAIEMDLAETFLNAKLPDEALKSLKLAIVGLKRPPARFYHMKGKALQAKGQTATALRSFRQALALDPKSADTLLAMAEIYAVENKHADSLAMIERARRLNPDSVPVLRYLVVEGMKAGNHLAALEAAQKLTENSPNNPDDLYLAGAAMLEERKSNAAVTVLEKYIAQRSGNARAWLGLGIAYSQEQRYADARKALENSVQLDPSLPEAEYQLGLVAKSEGKSQEAIRHLERAVQLRPEHAKALTSLGALYIQTGELEKAQDSLQRSETANPNDPETEYDLGLVLSKRGKTEQAREHLERFRVLKESQHQTARE
jgi:tetratricopeptide (TPR) repeat protein